LALNAATGSWIINGSVIKNGTLNFLEGSTLLLTSSLSSTLQQMTVNGDIAMTPGTALALRGGLSLNGRILMNTNSLLRFGDAQTLANGTIEFIGSAATIEVITGATVTFAPSVLVHGRSGTIQGVGSLINQGKISADVAGGTIRVNPATFTNEGQLEAINGGILIAPGFP